MQNSVNDHYRSFFEECIDLFHSENERLKVRYDSNKNYSEKDLSDLISNSSPDDFIYAPEWYSQISDELEKVWGGRSPKGQSDLNEAYKLLAIKVSERDGGPLYFEEKDIIYLTGKMCDVDDRCEAYCKHRFTFFRPDLGAMNIGDDKEKTLNLRIDDACLKYEALFGANIATFCHLLRSVCKPSVGMLSRIILSRSLLELVLHTYYISRRIHAISLKIISLSAEKSIEELNVFKNQFIKGLFGNSTLNINSESPKPYNILTCMQIIESDAEMECTYEEVEKTYGILSDFSHPKFAMRSSVIGLGPAPGDYFSYELSVDQAFTGDGRSAEVFHHLLNSINISIKIISRSFDLKESTRIKLNEKNLQYRTSLQFNQITDNPRS